MGHHEVVKICPACSREYPDGRTCVDCGVALVALNAGGSMHPEDLVGTVVDGRYRIEQIIGKGGMGTVYLCRHVVVGKLAAMKVLRPTAERSEGVLQRFIREAQTANAIRSRHIVEMTDFGQLASGAFYVVMELLEGTDLTRAMRSGKLTRGQLLHIFIQVAETLELAHAQDIVHRDLKPDNVFLVNEAGDPLFVKILDFGIAKILHTKASGLTETGVILGTPYYMSPEQARAEHVDNRSDIYALGVIMYRAFTGRLPFIAESSMGVLTRHLTEEPERPSALVEIDPAIEEIILRCLRKNPAHRFQTMADLAEALRSAQGAAPGINAPIESLRAMQGGDSSPRVPGPGSHTPSPFTPASWVPGFTPSGGMPPALQGHDAASSSGPHLSPSGRYPAPSGALVPSSGPHLTPNTYPSNPPSGPHSASASGRIVPSTPIPPYGPGPYGEGTQRSLATSTDAGRAAKSGRGLVIASGATLAVAIGAIVAIGVYGKTRANAGDPEIAASTGVSLAASAVLAVPALAAESAAPPAASSTAAVDSPAAPVATAKPTSEPVSVASPPRVSRAPRAPAPTAQPSPQPPPARRAPEIRSPFD